MYSLDVNFLRDRRKDTAKDTAIITSTQNVQEQIPLYIGVAVMVGLPALAGLAILVINWQETQIVRNIEQLTTEVDRIAAQNNQVQIVAGKTKAIDEQVNSLIGVFDQVKPWSAILQDLSDQTPAGVQISNIQQAGQQLTLNGFASSYSALNDFVLALQNSRFFKADQTKLLTANQAPYPIIGVDTIAEGSNNQASGTAGQQAKSESSLVIPQGVKYSLQTQLTDAPDQQLLTTLIRKGSPGLVARFKLLEQVGALKGPSDSAAAPPAPASTNAAPLPNP